MLYIGEKECSIKYFYIISFKNCRGSVSSYWYLGIIS